MSSFKLDNKLFHSVATTIERWQIDDWAEKHRELEHTMTINLKIYFK